MTDFNELLGKTIVAIDGNVGSREIKFSASDGSVYRQLHYQDCCEDVEIDEIAGDLADLIGYPVLLAEEVTYENEPSPDGKTGYDSYTWTFYKIRTLNGDVTIKWLGNSNGYYSESVYFERVM